MARVRENESGRDTRRNGGGTATSAQRRGQSELIARGCCSIFLVSIPLMIMFIMFSFLT